MSTSCQWQLNIAYYTRNDTATSCHWQLKQLCKQLTLQTTSRQDIQAPAVTGTFNSLPSKLLAGRIQQPAAAAAS